MLFVTICLSSDLLGKTLTWICSNLCANAFGSVLLLVSGKETDNLEDIKHQKKHQLDY